MNHDGGHNGVLIVAVIALLATLGGEVVPGQAAGRATTEDSTQRGCDLARSIVSAIPNASIQGSTGVFTHEGLRDPVRGCRLDITASFEDSAPGSDAASRLREGFTAEGWQEMPAYSADGKDGTAFAFRKAEVACLFAGTWDGASDGEPSAPRAHSYTVSVLCTSPAPPEDRTGR